MHIVANSIRLPGAVRLGIWASIAAVFPLAGCNQMMSTNENIAGVRAYQTGNYEAARQQFTSALTTDPKSAEGYYNLAATYHRLGKVKPNQADLQQAENLYNQALDRNGNFTDCYRGLAVLLVETGRSDAALRLLNGWSAKSPERADPKIETARLLEELGDRQKATLQLQEALAVDPHNARALTALGRLREESGDPAQALANYQRSLATNRNQPQVQARVAALQTTVGTSSAMAAAPPGQTQTVNQPGRTQRY